MDQRPREALAGPHAVGLLVDGLVEDASDVRLVMTALADPIDWATLAPGVDPQRAEAQAMALMTDLRESLLDLTVAFLLAPGGVVTWDQIITEIGEEFAGSGHADDDTVTKAWDELASGRIEPITPGWPDPQAGDEGAGLVYHLDPADTGATDRWELALSGTPVEPVPDLNGAWQLIDRPNRMSGRPAAMGVSPVLRERIYWLSEKRSERLDP